MVSVFAVDNTVDCEKPCRIWTMISPSTFKAFVFLHAITQITTGIFTKQLSRSRTFVAGMLIVYTVRSITKTWNALAHAVGVRPFSKMGTSYPMLNPTRIMFETLSRREDTFDLNEAANDNQKASGPVREKEEVAFEVCERPTAIEETLR